MAPRAGPPSIDLNEEKKTALQFINDRRGSAFITGKAGTGKSTLLRYYQGLAEYAVAVVAPTGVAAINVGGQTIHSLFGLPPRFIDRKAVRPPRNPRVLQQIDALVIDEVSMVRADLMDGVDQSLRVSRSCNKPFGGVQVVLFGDVFQLPPVVKENELKLYFASHHGSAFFFDAHVFRQCPEFGFIELTQVYRQSDGEFIRLLNAIREGDVDKPILRRFNERVGDRDLALNDGQTVTLTATNQVANDINRECLLKIERLPSAYAATITGEFHPSAFPTDEVLTLKPGARVMFLRNDPDKRWVNGTIGSVEALRPNSVRVRIPCGTVEVERERWENIKYVYDEKHGHVEPQVIGVFVQLPLRIAYAVTIHKSQGHTFDKAYIDLGRGAFAHGQLYVALSRCRTLEGLRLAKPISIKDVIVDPCTQGYRQRFRQHVGQSVEPDSK